MTLENLKDEINTIKTPKNKHTRQTMLAKLHFCINKLITFTQKEEIL